MRSSDQWKKSTVYPRNSDPSYKGIDGEDGTDELQAGGDRRNHVENDQRLERRGQIECTAPSLIGSVQFLIYYMSMK